MLMKSMYKSLQITQYIHKKTFSSPKRNFNYKEKMAVLKIVFIVIIFFFGAEVQGRPQLTRFGRSSDNMKVEIFSTSDRSSSRGLKGKEAYIVKNQSATLKKSVQACLKSIFGDSESIESERISQRMEKNKKTSGLHNQQLQQQSLF